MQNNEKPIILKGITKLKDMLKEKLWSPRVF